MKNTETRCVNRRFGWLLSAAVIGLGVAASFAPAQDAKASEPLIRPTIDRRPSPVWRLSEGTRYEDSGGIIFTESIKFRGTMNWQLLPTMQPGNTPLFGITDVNWLIKDNVSTEETYVSGGGTYRVWPSVGLLQVVGHQMTLQLKWGNDSTLRTFDSGVVAMVGSQAGRNVDIVLTEVRNTRDNRAPATIRVRAGALPQSAIRPFAAGMADNEFLSGCYDPCACALQMQQMDGRFGVVELPPTFVTQNGVNREVALVNMNFRVLEPQVTPVTPLPPPTVLRTFRGAGILQQVPQFPRPETPSVMQRVHANLVDSLPTLVAQDQFFDSGWVGATVAWPRIDVSIADNDFFCYNRVLHINARPAPVMAPAPRPIPHLPPVIPIDSPPDFSGQPLSADVK